MKFNAAIFLASLVALAAANPVEGREPAKNVEPVRNVDATVEARDIKGDLDRRACTYNGCKCQAPPHLPRTGVYCANCPVAGWPGYNMVYDLGSGGARDHVYQCNTNGDCCDYGYATACRGGAAGRCA
jgi:hypothetical protein